MDDRKQLLERIRSLEAMVAELRQDLAERAARIAELEEELKRRDKNYRPKQNTKPKGKPKEKDGRRLPNRKHPGAERPAPVPDENTIHHDVYPESCEFCDCKDLSPTGVYEDHYVEDIPEPKPELHCFRRHVCRCEACDRSCQGRGDMELPGAHIGPRARWFACYARAHLGISLGKTADVLWEFFGLDESRAAALGHLRWGASICAPVVQELLKLLRESPVVHADETGWRINGKNVWAWCFANPRLAVFLIDHHRSRAVLFRALGDTLPGVLVSDFYAVYDGMKCLKQRCLPHLLRELHRLREVLPAASVSSYIQPVMDLLKDAIALGKRREEMKGPVYAAARRAIFDRLDHLILEKHPRQADCRRIQKRLFKYCNQLFTFLNLAYVPSDNSLGERDIRSVAATRSDGGTNRTDWGAHAFATIKSVIRTCQKNGIRFLDYAMSLLEAHLAGTTLPMPLNSS